MPAKLRIHLPDGPVAQHVFDNGDDVSIGRDTECRVTVAHPSVSRRHARLFHTDGAWRLSDLGSKNGTRADGERITEAALDDRSWFIVGDVHCEFESIDDMQRKRLEADSHIRHNNSIAWSTRLDDTRDSRQTIATLLEGMVDIAECERGFLLIASEDGTLHIHACYGLEPSELSRPSFTGSRSAIERAISERRSVFLSDRSDHAWLHERASVVSRGLRAMACLPLLEQDKLLGVVYADTSDTAKLFTQLDAELLSAFAARAASVLAAERIDRRLRGIEQWLAVDKIGVTSFGRCAPAWSDILRDAT